MQEIMVSIICNVYNHGPYIRDALEGFVKQKTNFNFEVLVHDDASTDDSPRIIQEYEKEYPELVKPILQTENQYSRGGGITKRFQLPRVKGKYIAVCEGDDYWTDPLKLQKQVDFLEANPDYSMCACSTVWLDMRTNKQVNLCKTAIDKDVSIQEIILEKSGRIFQYGTILTKAEVFLTRPEWTWSFGVGDTPLEMYAALCGKIRMLADTMAVYRNHAAGSWTSRMEGKEFRIRSFNRMIEGFQAFNDATQCKYDDVVTERIARIRYNIARANRDWNAIRSGELREVYNSRSLITRFSDMLYCKAPGLQEFIRKLVKN